MKTIFRFPALPMTCIQYLLFGRGKGLCVCAAATVIPTFVCISQRKGRKARLNKYAIYSTSTCSKETVIHRIYKFSQHKLPHFKWFPFNFFTPSFENFLLLWILRPRMCLPVPSSSRSRPSLQARGRGEEVRGKRNYRQ